MQGQFKKNVVGRSQNNKGEKTEQISGGVTRHERMEKELVRTNKLYQPDIRKVRRRFKTRMGKCKMKML